MISLVDKLKTDFDDVDDGDTSAGDDYDNYDDYDIIMIMIAKIMSLVIILITMLTAIAVKIRKGDDDKCGVSEHVWTQMKTESQEICNPIGWKKRSQPSSINESRAFSILNHDKSTPNLIKKYLLTAG